MVAALVYGAPVSVSTDFGATFRFLDARSEHIDWCAVDWSDPAMGFILALKHEQDGLLIASNDGGKSFRDVGKGYISGWVFDDRTAVVAAETPDGGELRRTTDGGATFAAAGNFTPPGNGSARTLPKWKDGKLYWLTRDGLIASGDKGATWTTVAKVDEPLNGPVSSELPLGSSSSSRGRESSRRPTVAQASPNHSQLPPTSATSPD